MSHSKEMAERFEVSNLFMVYIYVFSHSDVHGQFLRLGSFPLTFGTTCLAASVLDRIEGIRRENESCILSQ